MKLLKSVIYIILSIFVGYLGWLIFYFLTPHIMSLSWFWGIVMFFIGAGLIIPLVGGILGFIPALLATVIEKLRSNTNVEKVLLGLIILFFTFNSCRLAWSFDINYGAKSIFLAIQQNIFVLGLFWGLGLCLVENKNE